MAAMPISWGKRQQKNRIVGNKFVGERAVFNFFTQRKLQENNGELMIPHNVQPFGNSF
jgi:hypothetical protein